MSDETKIYTRTQLKKWFSNGQKPTENHFAAAFDSYLHKSDTLPASQVDGLTDLLRLYMGVTREQVDEMIAAHDQSPDAHNIGTATDFSQPLESIF